MTYPPSKYEYDSDSDFEVDEGELFDESKPHNAGGFEKGYVPTA